MTLYLGLDVHSKWTVYVAQDKQGKVVGEGRVPTSEAGLRAMIKQVKAKAGTAIGLETGTLATWSARRLSALGMAPVVLEAREVRAKARRVGQKSDRRDAWEICDGLRRDVYQSRVYVPAEPIEQLRRLISRRRHFVRLAASQVNAAKFLLRAQGMGASARSLGTERAWQRLLAKPEVTPLRAHLAMHADLWQTAREKVAQLEEELQPALLPFKETMTLLQTAPAVGPITAATFIAALATPERFPDSAHVVSYLGLAVSTWDSGQRQRHGGITKRGSSECRAMLCEAAHHAAHPRHPLHPYFARVCGRQGYKRAVVCVAQRLARILWRMWRDGRAFDLNRLNVEPVRKVKTRTVYYQLKSGGSQSATA